MATKTSVYKGDYLSMSMDQRDWMRDGEERPVMDTDKQSDSKNKAYSYEL